MKRKKSILLGIFFLMFVTVSCQGILGGSSEAEKTLEAIYVEQTVEAEIEKRERQSEETQLAIDAIVPTEEPMPTEEPVPTEEPAPTEELIPTEEPASTEEPPTITPTPILHTLIPDRPGWVSQWWNDTNSQNSASHKTVYRGENYNINLLERPFTAVEMDYRPDLDLKKVEISIDDSFYYFTLYLVGLNPETSTLNGWYGIEFDLNRDGRGELLLWVRSDDNTSWNIEDVYLYKDSNFDVGGYHPLEIDAPYYTGDSYETLLFSPEHLDDPDIAWKRRDPANATVMQLALKRSLLSSNQIFMWNAWADDGQHNPANFDYNDFFTLEQAGTPYEGNWNYPIEEVYLVDNTCRLAFGFDPVGNEPGGCYVYVEPTAVPRVVITLPPPPCDCDDYTFCSSMPNQVCCEYCGCTWGGGEFPCYP